MSVRCRQLTVLSLKTVSTLSGLFNVSPSATKDTDEIQSVSSVKVSTVNKRPFIVTDRCK